MWSRESFTEGPRKEKDGSRSKRPPILDGFLGKVLIGRIWGGPQGSWLSSDGLVVRCQGSVPGISCSAEVAILPRGGGQRRTRRYCSVRPLSRKQDPAPWPRYRFFLQSLTSLTNPHPHPHPVRTQGRSGKLKKSPRNKKKRGRQGKAFIPRKAPQDSVSVSLTLTEVRLLAFYSYHLGLLKLQRSLFICKCEAFFFLKHSLFT